ncbi:chitin synthase-domain-containing protein [Entophlyctis helioformis]|nr:chitin synthase-domain-containing protein [Entophlyctis helioformis]
MVRPGRANIYAPAVAGSGPVPDGFEPVDDLFALLPDAAPAAGAGGRSTPLSSRASPTRVSLGNNDNSNNSNNRNSTSRASTSEPASLSPAVVAANLLLRLAKEEPYTRVGHRSLVAVRPPRALAKCSDAASKDYAETAKALPTTTNPNAKATVQPPHVFGVAASAYTHMARQKLDQAIVLIGESGSGKSESHHMAMRCLCDLSKASKKKTKMQSNILKVDSVLSAFGSATTPSNPSATCFVRYSELQFDPAGRMVGMKLIETLIEKGRVSGPADGGHSFHIFYLLLDGASHDERVQWHLSDAAHFRFLNNTRMRTPSSAQGKGAPAFDEIRENLKALGVGRRQQTQLWQLLAAILHLGNIMFADTIKEGETCTVRNMPQLQMVADMLGIPAAALQTILTSRSRYIGKDVVAALLDASGAARQRDAFAHALYGVAFGWIVEQINQRLCQPETDWSNFVSLLDAPGMGGADMADNNFHRLLANYANEQLLAHAATEIFTVPRDAFVAQDIPFPVNVPSNNGILSMLAGPRTGVIPIIDSHTVRPTTDEAIAAKIYEVHHDSAYMVSSSSKKMSHAFGVKHFGGNVEYDVRGFRDQDSDVLQSDFVTLIRGSPEQPGTSNVFLRTIFSSKLINTRTSARDGQTVVSANNKGRFPSLRRKKTLKSSDDEDESLDVSVTVGHAFRSSMSEIIDTIAESQAWFIFHIKTSDGAAGSKVDERVVERQVANFHLADFAANPASLYTSIQSHADFVARYKSVVSMWERDPKAACESLYRYRNWTKSDALIGNTSIFLSETSWKWLEDKLRVKETQDAERKAAAAASGMAATNGSTPRVSGTNTPLGDATRSMSNPAVNAAVDGMFSSNFDQIGTQSFRTSLSLDSVAAESDNASHYDSEFEYAGDVSKNVTGGPRIAAARSGGATDDVEMGNMKPKKTPPPVVKKPMSRSRCCWLSLAWGTTFCCIPPFLSICGRMRDWSRQIAWREKVALCFLIFLMNASILFFIVGLGLVLCPKKNEMSPGEISAFFTQGPKASIYMYGSYYYIPKIVENHVSTYMDQQSASIKYWETRVLGQDTSIMFPRDSNDAWGTYCPNFVKPPGFQLREPIATDSKWYPHTGKDFFATLRPNRKGDVVWDKGTIRLPWKADAINSFFLGEYFKNVTDRNAATAGVDSTPLFEFLRSRDPGQHQRVMACLNGLFYVGKVDHRQDIQCVVPNYILLGASAILVAVIGFKFLAALQFPGKRQPEDSDKFVICQVPCYTEGEVSLRRTIDSLSNLGYDDKHKLLFIICDGMIIGSGNDRPTPRIVLDILGVDPSVDPDSLAFQSLGEGNAQLNMAKVYSGLYEINGHTVPFIVIVKVGKPSERTKPGNRGKRDSQLILMRFLNRVHFNLAMCPLDLEIYHHMKNVIGVDPAFYEFVFMVDADTQVHTDSLNYLVTHMTRDGRIMGACGETNIANERKSYTSMIQVYEYFISHHLAKAFESLFGSVTCLPGCFSIYRIRSPKNVPILVAPGVLVDYSENTVDTLHLKNLLHLGEDRYLTTLLLKHFPAMKTTFTPDAKCETYAPEQWSVLLSQRRRWINSTVHNLFELLKLKELCGFCCLSMRFVVFIDLLATFIQPSALIYVGYLLYLVFTDQTTNFPVISMIMIACVYGFQVVVFLLRTEWQHIGWMVMYMLAIPLFSFYIPLYSFWHFDDFSWGNTRTVLDEGKPVEKPISEIEWFDPDSVPLMKWADYEAQRKPASSEHDDAHSVSSYVSGNTYKSVHLRPTAGGAYTAYSESNYGGSGGSAYGGPGSVTGSAFGANRAAFHQQQMQPTMPMGGPGMDAANRSLVAVPPAPVAARRTPTPGFPSDQEILNEIRHILSTTDLMKVTKKSVREQLSTFFGVDLSSEKEYIHRCIDGILSGEL